MNKIEDHLFLYLAVCSLQEKYETIFWVFWYNYNQTVIVFKLNCYGTKQFYYQNNKGIIKFIIK